MNKAAGRYSVAENHRLEVGSSEGLEPAHARLFQCCYVDETAISFHLPLLIYDFERLSTLGVNRLANFGVQLEISGREGNDAFDYFSLSFFGAMCGVHSESPIVDVT